MNESRYFNGNMWAEMSKSACYTIDILVNDVGIIEEAQCECGAGQGPTAHCKHVATIYLGLVQFGISGTLLTELTCTQVRNITTDKPC